MHKKGNIKMISFLSLFGLILNKETDGNEKGRKKSHLFPSSLREIAVIISAASHF